VLTAIAFTSKLGGIKVPRLGPALGVGTLQRAARESMINRDERYIEGLNRLRQTFTFLGLLTVLAARLLAETLPCVFLSAAFAALG